MRTKPFKTIYPASQKKQIQPTEKIINPSSINIIHWKMAGVWGKDRVKCEKRPRLTGNESETRN